jgi:SNF2 family DNA or RNA helicase
VIEALRNPPPQDVPPDLVATLRPYQLHGYSWLATLGDLGLGACLADDMGLGKTVQAIAYLLRRRRMPGRKRSPSLVICPTSVLGNWQREIERFAPRLSVVPHHGARRDPEEFANSDVVITTYGLLVRDREELASIKWDSLILDEAQAIKNPDSQRARSARGLTARHRVSLSGTPVENRLDELWSLMEFLVPGLLGPRARFQREVAVPIERFGDQDMAKRLKLGVSPFLLRRMKTDPNVISDLPDKIERNEYCPLTAEQARLYKTVVEDHLEKIADAADIERRGLVLSMLTRHKQVCNHPAQYAIAIGTDSSEIGRLSGRSGKLERCEELVTAIVDNNERALIFTQYTEMGELLVRQLTGLLDDDVPFLQGGTPQKKRDELVRAFQEDESASPILVVSLRAGGTGLNLTRATHVIHYDRWWNPAIEDQATDRAYRIGQRRDVLVHKLVTVGTLEERIDQRMAEKRQLAESVVGVGERWITELDDNALRMLVTLGEDAVVEGS